MPLSKQAEKEVTVLAALTDPRYQGTLDAYSTMQERENIVGAQVSPQGQNWLQPRE